MRSTLALWLTLLVVAPATAAPARRCLSPAMRCCDAAPASRAPARLSCAGCCRFTITPAVPSPSPVLLGDDARARSPLAVAAAIPPAPPPVPRAAAWLARPRPRAPPPPSAPLWLAKLSLLV